MTTIKDAKGNILLSVPLKKDSKRMFTLMKQDYVLLKFSLAVPLVLPIGSYVELEEFGRFELTDLYIPKQSTKYTGWDYELQLDATYWKWKNKIFMYDPESGSNETSWSLTSTLETHASILLRNLAQLGYKYNETAYTVSIDSSVSKDSRALTYSDQSILDALTALADAWECEWWVAESVIHFGRCEFGDTLIDFEVGKNCESMTASGTRETYATRIYAFGSTNNLPTNYRPTAETVVVNGVVQKRLMLPEDIPYIDARPNMAQEEAVETVLVFDDIYPRFTNGISNVTTKEYDEQDDDGNPTGEKWNAYRFRDSSIVFKEAYILPDTDLQVKFETGTLAGMTFQVKFNPDAVSDETSSDAQVFEVIRNEDYGRPLPDDTLKPKDGDNIILIGWDSTQIASLGLVAAAEQELKEAAEKEVEDLKQDANNYSCKMISAAMFTGEDYFLYSLGDRVRLINKGYFADGYRDSRIIGFEYDLVQPFNSPVYIVGEKATYSRLNALENEVSSITIEGQTYQGGSGSNIYVIRSGENTPSSDTNVHSAKRSDQRFLRKDANDRARGVITHEQQSVHIKGAQYGEEFISGLAGIGGRIDGNGNGELESLFLRAWLEVPEIRFNKVSVYIGIRFDTFGGGIIEEVTPDATGLETGTGKLKLEDGDIGAIAVGDLCMGIWHDTEGNDTESSDDNKGKFSFAGFKTVYFQITAVSGANNENFSYMLRSEADGGNGVHPFVGMHFAGRGNTVDEERRAFTYTTTEYSVALKDVKTWEFQSENYYEIRGHIEGFSMPATDKDGNTYTKVFHGYGQVFGNAYIFGEIDQFERQEYRMKIDQSLNGSLAPNETETVTCTIYNGYGEDVTSQFTLFAVTRTTGDEATDALWNAAHTNVGNPFEIAFADLGIDGIHKLLATFNVTATDEATDTQATQELDYFS